MKKQVLFTILIVLPLVAMADDSGKCGASLTWTYTEATKTLTISGTGEMTDYDYSNFSNYSPWHSYSDDIVKVSIGEGVTSIGDAAFVDCTSLTSIQIPNSVTSIGEGAFSGCTGLNSVTIGNSVTSIGYSAFFSCTRLTSISIPNSVTSIGRGAFSWCTGLTSVTIGNSVTYIGTDAFSDCSNLKQLTFYCKEVSEWFDYDYKSNIQQVFIGESVKTIGYNAFNGFTGLTSVTIPNSVTNIGDWAFSGCSSLTSIEIPNSVTSIGERAFEACKRLASITIPRSVTEIGYSVFRGCSSMTSITVDPENMVYDSRENCNGIIESETNTLIQGCKNTIIPDGVVSIGRDAFSECTGLTSIILPSSIKSINDAFYGCTKLSKVVISDLEAYCKIIFSRTYVDSETCLPLYYAKHLFLNDEEIKDLVIPTNTTTIQDNLFRYCDGIESIELHKDITKISGYAFSDCNNIQKIVLFAKRPSSFTSGYNPFTTNVYNNCTLYVPEGSENAYYVADGWKNFKKIETFKEQQPEKVPQDVNGDGVVDTQDVLEIYKYIQEH